MNLINVSYDSTNYYLTGQDHCRLLIDVGWPGTLPKLLANLKRKGVALQDIGYLFITHYHPDHAGLTQELKNQGVRWLLLEQQTGAVSTLKTLMKPGDHFLDIQIQDAVRLETRTSRAFLKSIGVSGEIIHTPGHSSDSMTLVLDEGLAFTGDLPGLGWTVEEHRVEVEQSWQKIREMNVKMIYPGHGPERSLDQFA